MIKEFLFNLDNETIFFVLSTLILGELFYIFWINKCKCSLEKDFMSVGWLFHKAGAFLGSAAVSGFLIVFYENLETTVMFATVFGFLGINYCIARYVYNKRKAETKQSNKFKVPSKRKGRGRPLGSKNRK